MEETIKSGTWRNEQIRNQQHANEPERAPHSDATIATGRGSKAAGMERTLRGWQLLLAAHGINSSWSGIQPPAIPDGTGRLMIRLPSGKELCIILEDRPLQNFLEDRSNRAWARNGHFVLIVPSCTLPHPQTYSVVPNNLAHESGGRGRWFDSEADACSPGRFFTGQASGELIPSAFPLLWWKDDQGQLELWSDHPEQTQGLLRGAASGRAMNLREAEQTYRLTMGQAMAEETWPQAKPWEIMSQKLVDRATGWSHQQAEEISVLQSGRPAARLRCHRVLHAELIGAPKHPQLDVVPFIPQN